MVTSIQPQKRRHLPRTILEWSKRVDNNRTSGRATHERQSVAAGDAWMHGCMIGWLVDWMVGWLDGWMIGWLDDWMVGWLDGWMIGWLIRWFAPEVQAPPAEVVIGQVSGVR